jgi:hypothetical protein
MMDTSDEESIALGSMEIINGTDALYHNCEHTVMVSLAGQDILAGKIALGDQVSAQQWATYVISLLFHDVGYIKRLLPGDTADDVVVDQSGTTQTLPPGATDAALTRFHVDRGMAFVARKYASCQLLDVSAILENIENYLLNCHDAVGLLLMIKVTHLQRMVMQRRRIPTLDSFFDRISMLLWPRYVNIHTRTQNKNMCLHLHMFYINK